MWPCGQYCYAIDRYGHREVDHTSLAAMAKGLGTCWSGTFHEDKVKGIGTPENIPVVVMLTLGYPAESPATKPRKKREETEAYDEWPSSVCECEMADWRRGGSILQARWIAPDG
jgi:hypothetical protein